MVFLRTTGLCLLLLLCLHPVPLYADVNRASEHELKAAFIYNFIRFVEWPASALPESDKPFKICIVDSRAVGNAFASLSGVSAKGHTIEVRQYLASSDVVDCHVVFWGNSTASSRILETVKRVKSKPILMIGETDDFLGLGGMIRFVTSNGKLAFEINHAAAKKSGLTISSKVLSLARNRLDLR